jgi:sec-independent protein translocase protein TatA
VRTMFNIGPMELIVILLVALLIVGPKRLPEVGRSIGKSLRELRRATEEVRYSFESSQDDESQEEAAETGEPGAADDGSSPDGSDPATSDPARPRIASSGDDD